ncbi:carbon-nitrogen hydrolase family protein [Domibacillus iocasae]|uniref:CN hydrolase domain-containing protein n=1 Tax=Domibacillus iocasae TaxID=1714016 RepID=A0A1E7DP68_9BACI|nr:carbon-nitrogen hydrolase family protein [Domibacillus iocasae]OES44805.1 hypothetical protein BA724_05895 [Domibacillus iocasae]
MQKLTNASVAIVQSLFKKGCFYENQQCMEQSVQTTLKTNPAAVIFLFPELTLSGYSLERSVLEEAAERREEEAGFVKSLAKWHGVYIVYGYAEKKDGKFYNTAEMVGPDGSTKAVYRKIHLTPFERGVFEAGSELVVAKTEWGTAGLMICWDLAFPEMARSLALKGADILLVPAAWEKPYEQPFQTFCEARAMENNVFVAACNHNGTTDGLHFFGHSSLFTPGGEKWADAQEHSTVVTGLLDWEERKRWKSRFFSMMDERRPDVYEGGGLLDYSKNH